MKLQVIYYLILTLLTVIICHPDSHHYPRQDWGAHQITLENLKSTNPSTYGVILNNYKQGGSYNYQNINAVGTTLCGFNFINPNTIIFNISTNYNSVNNSAILNIKLFDSTQFGFVSFFVIILAQNCQYLEIINQCFQHNRASTRTHHNVSVQKTYKESDVIEAIAPIASMNLTKNSDHRLYIYSNYKKIYFSQNLLQVNLGISTVQVNQLQTLCLTIVIFNYNASNQQNLHSYIGKQFANELSDLQNNFFGIPDYFGPILNKNCMFGIRYLRILQNTTSPTLFINFTLANITDISFQVSQVTWKILCLLGNCEKNNGQYYSIKNKICANCSQVMKNCQQCVSSNECTKCNDGQLVTGTCNLITGCISSHLVDGKLKCFFCNHTMKLRLQNNVCICKQGYILNNQNCVQFCGDGFVTISQQCDDKNTNNGDGCSNQCNIEVNFTCAIDSASNSSACQQIVDFKVRISHISRSIDSNTAEFVFVVLPIKQNLNLINFTKLVELNISEVGNIIATNYIDKKLIIKIQYTQSIEAKIFLLTVEFNEIFFKSAVINYEFTVKGQNAPLLLSHYLQQYTIASYFCYFLMSVSLVIFCISLLTHNMIGLEMLSVLQMICFTMAFIASDQSLILALHPLKYTNGINFYDINAAISHLQIQPLCRLGFQQQFFMNFISNSIMISISTVFWVFTKVKLYFTQFQFKSSLDKQEKAQFFRIYQNNKAMHGLVYERLVIPLTLLSLPQFIYSFSTYKMSPFSIEQIIVFPTFLNKIYVMLYNILVFLLVFPSELNRYFTRVQFGSQVYVSNKYIIFHFCYIFTLTLLLFSTFKIILSWIGLYFFILLIWRPYSYRLHNIGIIMNQFIYCAFVSGLICIEIFQFSETHVFLFVCLIILAIAFIIVFSIYRIYMDWKYKQETFTIKMTKFEREKQQKKAKLKKQSNAKKKKDFTIVSQSQNQNDSYYKKLLENPYRIENQIIREKKKQYDKINSEREALGLKPLVYDYREAFDPNKKYYIPKKQVKPRTPTEFEMAQLEKLKKRLREEYRKKNNKFIHDE